MPIAEITAVSQAPQESPEYPGCFIDSPIAGDVVDSYAIKIMGWVVISQPGPAFVVATWNGQELGRIKLRPRPDVAAAFPDVPEAVNSGFCLLISLLGVASDASILLRACVVDGPATEIGIVHVRHAALRRVYRSSIQPILLTSIGRSGSKWLLMLIAQHPEIVALRPSDLEPRALHYWMSMFRGISHPKSYLQVLAADLSNPQYWLGQTLPPAFYEFPGSATSQWLGRTSIETLAAFCQQQVESFYRHVALVEDKRNVRYFVEKHVPDSILSTLVFELFPDAREIFLVRDLRDAFCSMMAFNAKNQQKGFLKEQSSSDQQFIGSLRDQARVLLAEWKSRAATAHLVRYEDLIPDPAGTMTAIFKHLGLDSAPATIEFVLHRASTFNLGQHRTAASADASIGRWQQDLSPDLQAACREAFGDILSEFGYGKMGS